MILPDVNVLIYAFRPDSQYHRLCKPWLDAVVLGDAPFGLSPLALSAVVRITTGDKAYQPPTSVERAFAFCDNLLGQPHRIIVEPGDRHWGIFSRLCMDTNTHGRRVSDAWYAALATEWGCEWITLDRDFARFPGLRWRTPDGA